MVFEIFKVFVLYLKLLFQRKVLALLLEVLFTFPNKQKKYGLCRSDHIFKQAKEV